MYLKVGSSIFSYTPAVTDVATSNIKFEGSATINGKANVELYGTLKSNAAGSVKFGSLDLTSFGIKEYVSNGITVATAVGSIAGINISVQDTPLNVTRVDGLGDTTVAAGSDAVTLYKVKLSSTQGNGVRVSNATFTVVAGPSFNNNTTLTLVVNGVAKESKTLSGTSVNFTSFGSVTVNKDSDATVEVVANINENVSNTQSIRLTLNTLTATDLLTSSAITTYTKPAGALFTVNTASAQVALSKDVVLSKLLLSPSTSQKVAAVKITAQNDTVRLYNVVLNVTGINAVSNVRLENASGAVLATATSINGSEVKFTNISGTPFVAKDLSQTYYVVADINSNVSTATDLVIGLVSANARASNGSTVGSATAGVANAHKVLDRAIVVAKVANDNKSLTTSALRFTVTAKGKDANLTSIVATLNQAGYTGTLTPVIYKNTVSAANIVAGATTVDARTTVTFIVAIPNAIVDSNSSSQDWNVNLSSISIDGTDVSSYTNVGDFPLTERK